MSTDLTIREPITAADTLLGVEIGGQRKTDAYGCELVYLYAVQACVKNTAYMLGFAKYGPQAKTPNTTAAKSRKVVVAAAAVATGAYGWFATRGVHELLIGLTGSGSANDGVILDGSGATVVDTVWDDNTYDSFAVLLETHAAGASVTSLCYLTGEPVTYT